MTMQPTYMTLSARARSLGFQGHHARQRGVALFLGLVFLVILTLVALVVMRGTMIEMRLTTATARHEQAFEASEALRVIPEAVMADHVRNRGWPSSWGGTVPDAKFDLSTTFANSPAWITMLKPNASAGTGLQNSCGTGSLVIFYLPQACASQTASYKYTPSQWQTAVKFITCDDGTTGSATACASGNQITTLVSILRDGVAVNKGSGAAQAQGYASAGVGAAQGGSALYLQVRSFATVPGNGTATTIAQYKLNIQN